MSRFLDWLLGPRCARCGQRVFTADILTHEYIEHAGDRAIEGGRSR